MRTPIAFAAALLTCCNGVPVASSTTAGETQFSWSIATGETRPRDVFFVVDSLPSPVVARRQSEIVRSIVSDLITGDIDHDGQLDITPIDDIRFMVIPSDPDYLRVHEVPEFVFHYAPDVDLAAFATTVADAAAHAFEGASAWPQPLEAAYFGVTEACVPNERADLGLVFITTQDDHSVATGIVSRRSLEAPSSGLPPLQRLAHYQTLLRRPDGRPTAIAIIGGVPDVTVESDLRPLTPRVPSSTELLPGECSAIALSSPDRLMAFASFGSATASYCGEIDGPLSGVLQWLSDGSAPRVCVYFDDPLDGRDAVLHEIGRPDAPALDCSVPGRAPDPANPRACVVVHASPTESGWYLEAHRDSSWECPNGRQVRFSRGFLHRGGVYRLDAVRARSAAPSSS